MSRQITKRTFSGIRYNAHPEVNGLEAGYFEWYEDYDDSGRTVAGGMREVWERVETVCIAPEETT